jgi:hypothetical protein
MPSVNQAASHIPARSYMWCIRRYLIMSSLLTSKITPTVTTPAAHAHFQKFIGHPGSSDEEITLFELGLQQRLKLHTIICWRQSSALTGSCWESHSPARAASRS